MIYFSKFISGIIGALTTLIFTIIYESLTKKIPIVYSISFSSIITIIIDISILYLFKFIMNISYLIPFLRKKLSSYAAAEGTWIEYVEKPSERAISIAKIKYYPLTFKFKYSGEAYDIDGNIQAIWNCETFLSENERNFTFIGKGKYLFNDKEVRLAGNINFSDNDFVSSKNFIKGKGSYYDYNVTQNEYDISATTNIFIMERYSTICQKYIKKDKPENNEEMKKVIIKYYKDKCLFENSHKKII